MPCSSGEYWMPVGWPKPKVSTHWLKRSDPSSRPIVTAPTFEDWARMSEVVSVR